jgi:nitrogen fixation/metabolism regulation signal transduction histidine kinase
MTAKARLSFEGKLGLAALTAGLLPSLTCVALLVYYGASGYAIGIVAIVLTIAVGYCVSFVHQRTAFQLRSISNLLEAMVQGDYSMRGRAGVDDSNLDELIGTINRLANRLSEQKLETRESQLLLELVIAQIDIAILTVDDADRVALANPAACRLIDAGNDLVGRNAHELGLVVPPDGEASGGVELSLGGGKGKFYAFAESFIANQRRQRLVFITDIQTILRDEERRAWQSLIRVLGHEINNSLSPITSISDTLIRICRRGVDEAGLARLTEGLAVIRERSQALSEFIGRYRLLTKLPTPNKTPTSLRRTIERIAPLFERADIRTTNPVDVLAHVDAEQFEQVLVNLLKNAIEASAPGAPVELDWRVERGRLRVAVLDQGCGVADTENLFVPYYSTKQQGSGIGLFLSRQIAFNHAGELQLRNRTDRQGAEAILWLPHHAEGAA